MNICNQTGLPCSIATQTGACQSTACLKRLNEKLCPDLIKNEEYECVGVTGFINGEHIEFTEKPDPVDIHDEISAGFSRIEKAIREESAKMAEIIREAIADKNPPVYIPQWAPADQQTQVVSHSTWASTIPKACINCSNHPSNGGSGICFCTLGTPEIT